MCCDSLSKKELWYICNNLFIKNLKYKSVVIRFQKRNFDIFATITIVCRYLIHMLWFAFKKGTLIYLQQLKLDVTKVSSRCDSLSKKELWYICNNSLFNNKSDKIVVIRFQKRNFDIFATIIHSISHLNLQLWFAFKKGTLIYLQQYLLT